MYIIKITNLLCKTIPSLGCGCAGGYSNSKRRSYEKEIWVNTIQQGEGNCENKESGS
jgi:hypothetical protein